MDQAIANAELVTVPIFEARLIALEARIGARFAAADSKVDARFASMRTELIIWIVVSVFGSNYLPTIAAAIKSAIAAAGR